MELGLSSSTSSATSSIGGGGGGGCGGFGGGTRDLDAWLSTWPNVHAQFRFLVTSLQRRKVHGSLQCAKMTIEVLKCVVLVLVGEWVQWVAQQAVIHPAAAAAALLT